ncbi:MAG: methyltransferase [Clostridiaceae bacterium]|nr:methyltransferase [Clostridiaceae bacterium]
MISMIEVEIWHRRLRLETDPRLFSPRQPDLGTLAMLETVTLQSGDQVLDLGCGYGLVGLAAAQIIAPEQVVLVDIDPLAVAAARRNAVVNNCPGVRIYQGDGPAAADAAEVKYTLILCNPPYHTDFSVARRLIEQSFPRLADGGRLILVVKRLIWYKNKMTSVFGGVHVQMKDGYYILTAEKRPDSRLQEGNPALLTEVPPILPPKRDRPQKTTRKHEKKMRQAERKTRSSGHAG